MMDMQGDPADEPVAGPDSTVLSHALGALGHAVVITDIPGRVTYWNTAAESLYGYSAEEARGRFAVELIVPPEGLEGVLRQGERVWTGAFSADWDLRDKHGRTVTVHGTTTVINDDDGNPVATLNVSYDVTAQRLADARSRHLAALVDASEDAIMLTELDGRILEANSAVKTVFGYHPDELIGQDITILVPADRRAEFADAMTDLARDLPVDTLTTQRLRKDDTVFDVSVRLSAVRDAVGSVVGMSGITRDISADVETRTLLESSELRYRARFERSGMPQALLDLHGVVLRANDALCQLLNRSRAEVENHTSRAFWHPTDPASEQTVVDLADNFGDARTWEGALEQQDESAIPILVQACLLRAADGTPYAVDCFIQDVSGMYEARHRLSASEARYRAIVDTAQEGIWTVDPDGNALYANQKMAEILGVDVDTIMAGTVPELLGAADNGVVLSEKLRTRQERGPEQYEVSYPHPDGDVRVLRLSVTPVRDETGPTGSLAMITNITDERRAEHELRRRALYDELTGLPNRGLLTDRLRLAVARSERIEGSSVAVLFADIDQFKLVNDSWGHEAGDRLLVAVAERLSAVVRSGDTVARFGGDEFIILREGASEAEAQELAARLLRALAEPFDLGGQRSYVTASIGIAVSPPSPGDELLRFADAAMYNAKSHGRGRAHLFELSLDDHANGQLSLSNDLQDALANDGLELFYQPLVDLATGRVVSVEALARWNHPTLGAVSPLQFVALAEAMGLASTLDRWALARACRDLGRLREATNPALRVAVNMSATHLAEDDVEVSVLATLKAYGLKCRDVELEITESAIMNNPDYARELLQRLRARGMSIAIDDFGTGYSSLGYLSRLPATTVKIDRMFVHNIRDDPDALAIVSSIIDLCRAMRLNTVAEGIETVEQLTLLHRLGCIAGQGFLWSPALAVDEFVERMSLLPNRRFDVTRVPKFSITPNNNGLGGTETLVAVEEVAPEIWGPQFAASLHAGHLSSRELEIVTRLSRGKRVPAIAAELFLTQGTVRNQLSSVYRKLGLRSQQELLDRIHAEI